MCIILSVTRPIDKWIPQSIKQIIFSFQMFECVFPGLHYHYHHDHCYRPRLRSSYTPYCISTPHDRPFCPALQSDTTQCQISNTFRRFFLRPAQWGIIQHNTTHRNAQMHWHSITGCQSDTTCIARCTMYKMHYDARQGSWDSSRLENVKQFVEAWHQTHSILNTSQDQIQRNTSRYGGALQLHHVMTEVLLHGHIFLVSPPELSTCPR